jgi:hypothetical protein
VPPATTTVVPKFEPDKRDEDSAFESHQPFNNAAMMLMASRSSSPSTTLLMSRSMDEKDKPQTSAEKMKPSLTVSVNNGEESDTSMTPIDITGKFRSRDSSAGSTVLGTRSGSKHLSLGSDSSRISHISSSSSEEEDEEEEEDDEGEEDNVVQDDLQEAMKTIPLRTLGSSVQDCLNRQQLQTIKTMWSLLRAGVEILKHGRSGKPKFKTLLCDVDMTKLYWRQPGSRPDPDLDESDIEVDSLYPGSIVPRSGHHGALFAASGAPIKKNKRISGGRRSSILKSNSERVIHFNQIVEVHDDCSSEVMKRSLAKQYVSGNTCVISIVMADRRSLDFEIREV